MLSSKWRRSPSHDKCSRRFCGSSRNYGRSHHPRQHEAFDCHAFKRNRQEECVQMPVKIARSTPQPSFGLPELLVASHISRLASRDAAKSLLSTLVSGSSEECRIKTMGRQNTDAGKKVISRLFERKMTGSGDNTVIDDIALRKPKRAALFFVEGYLGVQPSVVSAAIHLARHGYEVDLYFVRPDLAYPTPSLPAGIRLVEYSPYILDLTKCIRTIFPRSRAIDGNKAAIVTRKTTESFVRIRVRALIRKSEALINEFSKIVGFGLFCRRRV